MKNILYRFNFFTSHCLSHLFPFGENGKGMGFLFCFLFFSLFSLRAEPYRFLPISLKEGLSQITVQCICQDSKGFMWFGTRNGLNRYDGYDFDVFTNTGDSTGISDNHIICMTEDNEGKLWIGTNNGLNSMDLMTHIFKRYFHDPDAPQSLPRNTVFSIYHDKPSGNLWIGTTDGLSLYLPETDSFQSFRIGNLLTETRVNAIAQKDSILYIGTLNKGLIIYNIQTGSYRLYDHRPDDRTGIGSNFIKAIHIDTNDNLWIGTQGGGVSVLRKGETHFSNHYGRSGGLTSDYIRSITESPEKRIVIGTFNGLNIIDPATGEIDHVTDVGISEGALSHYSITATYFDSSQSLWVGTYAGGICYYNKYRQIFRLYSPFIGQNIALGILGPIVETEKSLYIATEGGGLLEMDKKTETFKRHKIASSTDELYEKNIIKSLFLEKDKLYCGTNIGTIYVFDTTTKHFRLIYDSKEEFSIYHIGRNTDGNLIIGGVSQIGLTFLLKDGTVKNKFAVKDVGDIYFHDVRCVMEIRRNEYLIGTRNSGIFHYNMNNQTLKNYKNISKNIKENKIPENFITCIVKSSDENNIYIGTFGGGISMFNPETGTFTNYNTKNNLLNNNVCSIVEDDDGNLWVSSITGISRFKPKTGEFKNYTHSNGIKIDEFTLHSGLKLRNNCIVFSGSNGFTMFNPHQMKQNPHVPPVVLKHLYINNNKIVQGGADGILSKQLDMQKEIVLQHKQSNISIEYSALNFIFSDKNQYRYKLEGFDNEWNDVGQRRIAYYTNIPQGDYTFVVTGANNDGLWNNNGAQLKIKVLPPVWETWWAYFIYFIILLLIIIFITKYFTNKKRLENDIKLKRMEVKTLAEFHEARGNLFTNFSHELRTPLTLILNPLEDMVKNDSELDPVKKKNILLMRSNVSRLLRLVNNLMDFQKRESGTMKLKVTQNDIVKFSREMISFFEGLALSRNIRLIYTSSKQSIVCWFDKSLMEKVYFNFLSNAFKNVFNEGAVEVTVETKILNELTKIIPEKYNRFTNVNIHYLLLEIKDSGIGIAHGELEKIFIPFYQIAQNEHSRSGTGLGLSLSKSIIEMHHGAIWAESVEGGGAVFKCVLPMNKDLFKPEEISENILDEEIMPIEVEIRDYEPYQISDDNKHKQHTLLVAEDNHDIRRYIISHLGQTYTIIEATNGMEAIEKSIRYLPDLIVTDLMMPKINGIQMCETLKKDLHTGHIPIIMLTAKVMPADMKEGYGVGADAYITKPFNIDVLVSCITSIIHSREKLKEIYGKKFSLESLGVSTSSLDERFMQKLYEVLEKNVSNPELNLDRFCKEICMSRANMYRKIKAITNLSPNEFIRNFRLEMGAKILRESQLSVSEVYVAVGFNSLAYFSNCFRALFGISPTEYVKQQRKGG